MAGAADVIERVRGDSAGHELYPPAGEDDLRTTQAVIGSLLPPSYRAFVTELSNGAQLYGVQGVQPVGDVNHRVPIHRFERIGPDDPDTPLWAHEDGWTTRYGDTVVFGGDPNGNEWCFLTARQAEDGECEVAYLDTRSGKLYATMASFAEWLGYLVDHPYDEVIRTYYEDDDALLYGEMMLG
jgi:hypothetical protein